MEYPKEMQAHQVRVVEEKTELDEKLGKLNEFFESTIFESLPVIEQERLKRQERAMNEYSQILGERISDF